MQLIISCQCVVGQTSRLHAVCPTYSQGKTFLLRVYVLVVFCSPSSLHLFRYAAVSNHKLSPICDEKTKMYLSHRQSSSTLIFGSFKDKYTLVLYHCLKTEKQVRHIQYKNFTIFKRSILIVDKFILKYVLMQPFGQTLVYRAQSYGVTLRLVCSLANMPLRHMWKSPPMHLARCEWKHYPSGGTNIYDKSNMGIHVQKIEKD